MAPYTPPGTALPTAPAIAGLLAVGGNITRLNFTTNSDGWAFLQLPLVPRGGDRARVGALRRRGRLNAIRRPPASWPTMPPRRSRPPPRRAARIVRPDIPMLQ